MTEVNPAIAWFQERAVDQRFLVNLNLQFTVDAEKADKIPGFPGIRIDGINDDPPVSGLEIVTHDLLEQITGLVRASLYSTDVRFVWRDFKISPDRRD